MSRGQLVVVVGSLFVSFGIGFSLHGALGFRSVGIVEAYAAGLGPGNQRCDAVTLKGLYGIKFDGFSIKTNQQLDSVSRITFDGFQTFTVSETGRFNGEPISRTFTGPYVVRPDCTGYLDYTTNLTDPSHAVHGEFVIVDQGQGFFVLDDEDGWQATGIARRL
jgi:hypothetical protein